MQKVYNRIIVALLILSMFGSMGFNQVRAEDPHLEYSWIREASVTVAYSYVSASPSAEVIHATYEIPLGDMTFDTTLNTTRTYQLISDAYYETDVYPELLNVTGVARTYSNSFYSTMSTTTQDENGIWQKLMTLPENTFATWDKKIDGDVILHYDNEALSTKMTAVAQTINAGWTHVNLTITDVYSTMKIYQDKFDAFATQVKADSNYDLVTSTDSDDVENLFDPYFAKQMLGMTYMPINLTAYATGWTIPEEIANVTESATDNSVLGAQKVTEIRNAIAGYTGFIIADDSVIKNAVDTTPQPDPEYKYGIQSLVRADDTDTYNIKVGLLSDFASGNDLIAGLTCCFAQIFPHVVQDGITAFPSWMLWVMPIGILLCILGLVVLGKLGYCAVAKKKFELEIKNLRAAALIIVVVYFVLVLLSYLVLNRY